MSPTIVRSGVASAALVALPALAQTPTLDWETTFSVTSETLEGADDMVVDAEGNSIVLGYLAVEQDFYVLKFDPDGDLLWSQIIGGTGLDVAGDIVLDAAGDILIAGRTLADDFPTLNAYKPVKDGPSDAFLMKLSGDDGSMMFSTYFGGTRAEAAFGIALGPDDTITIAGRTDSIDLLLVNPWQDHLTLTDCFCDDAFVTTFDANAQTVLYSTYIGGEFDDVAQDVEVDSGGNIVIAGRTRSEHFPMLNAVQPVYGGADFDGFVARFDHEGGLSYSTYLGGEDSDYMRGVAVGADRSAYVTGSTMSIGYPTTPGAFREEFIGINNCDVPFSGPRNCWEMFITELAPDGTLVYSTFLGGTRDDEPRNIVVDAAGRAYVTGYTFSGDFPMAPFGTVVVSRLDPTGTALQWVISHDTAGPNGGSAVAVRNDHVHVASNVGLPYDTYVAQYTDATVPGDATGDGVVDTNDLLLVLSDWGPCAGCASDLDGDGTVGTTDLLMVLANWS